LTKAKFDAISRLPDLITIIQDLGPDFAKVVALDPPGTCGGRLAHLFNEKLDIMEQPPPNQRIMKRIQ
jgi:hypothetical protein